MAPKRKQIIDLVSDDDSDDQPLKPVRKRKRAPSIVSISSDDADNWEDDEDSEAASGSEDDDPKTGFQSNTASGHVLAYIFWLAWMCLSLAPTALKNPVFDLVFPNEQTLTQILKEASLSFAPGLLDVLQSSTPPTIAFFKSLPIAMKGIWAVYLILLLKAGCIPKIYIGSGTDKLNGAKARMRSYHSEDSTLPKYVKEALSDGYKIAHKGLLCWMPIPPPAKQFSRRAAILVLETTLSLAL